MMPMAREPYEFRRVTAADFPPLDAWLRTPHVREWWGEPGAALQKIREHIDDPSMDVFIVDFAEKPLGYIQSWNPHAEPDHPCRDQPPGTRGIDQFIGGADLLNRGHGTAMIEAFLARLFRDGATRVLTDPNPANARAIRAYTKAGFRPLDRRVTVSGEALLMAADAPLPLIKQRELETCPQA